MFLIYLISPKVYPPTGSRPPRGRWAPHLCCILEHGPL